MTYPSCQQSTLTPSWASHAHYWCASTSMCAWDVMSVLSLTHSLMCAWDLERCSISQSHGTLMRCSHMWPLEMYTHDVVCNTYQCASTLMCWHNINVWAKALIDITWHTQVMGRCKHLPITWVSWDINEVWFWAKVAQNHTWGCETHPHPSNVQAHCWQEGIEMQLASHMLGAST